MKRILFILLLSGLLFPASGHGEYCKPGATELANIDILIFDIQDVRTCFYTYIPSLQEFQVYPQKNISCTKTSKSLLSHPETVFV